MKYICDECKEETLSKPYPFGHWYYDNNGAHHDIGKKIKICATCLDKYSKEENE